MFGTKREPRNLRAPSATKGSPTLPALIEEHVRLLAKYLCHLHDLTRRRGIAVVVKVLEVVGDAPKVGNIVSRIYKRAQVNNHGAQIIERVLRWAQHHFVINPCWHFSRSLSSDIPTEAFQRYHKHLRPRKHLRLLITMPEHSHPPSITRH